MFTGNEASEAGQQIGAAGLAVLRQVVSKHRETSRLWSSYRRRSILADEAAPLLVVQVPSEMSDAALLGLVQVVREQWPELGQAGIAHSFAERGDLDLGDEIVPSVPLAWVQRSSFVVLLVKELAVEDWDCARAQTLVSFCGVQERAGRRADTDSLVSA